MLFFSHGANWSANAHLCGSGYGLLSDESVSILNLVILCQSHLYVSFTARWHVCRFKILMTQPRYMLTCNYFFPRHLVFNLILSKLYTSSFLSSLNSRQGGGYDTSDNNDVVDLSTDLRFMNNTQLTFDQTSVVVTTPPVSPVSFFSHS
jgi:hypothetical protein